LEIYKTVLSFQEAVFSFIHSAKLYEKYGRARGNYASPQRFNGSSSAKEYEVASNEIGISRKVGVSQIPFALFSCLFGAFMTGSFLEYLTFIC
jgi:hypothetical protein